MWVVLLLALFLSCTQTKTKDHLTLQIGDSIRLMLDQVILDNSGDSLYFRKSFRYKIITYGNVYCHPCWEKVVLWKQHLYKFEGDENIGFFCYVYSSPKDFQEINKDAKLPFPVLLDVNERFRVVNKLSNIPEYLTFLVDQNNKVLFIGAPFSPEEYKQYLKNINSEK
ncbi:MAG: hypothetical protein JXR82_09105 [Marinifilaceae bacterium]|nr:hypothetical protein [Marinifilaceae bacterium]